MMQEYPNLISVTFDFISLPCVDIGKKQEILLMLDELQSQGCLYPAIFNEIPNLRVVIGLDVRKFKISFFQPLDIAHNTSHDFIISFSPYVGAIREYKDICNSYKDALVHDNSASIETIDMARRGLHNQAATLIQERFKDKIHGNHHAFRGLFSIMTYVF